MPSGDVLVRLTGVVKDFKSLRPLRIAGLDLHRGRSVSVLGLDQAMAEVLVDLITGAILPDRGEIEAFGRLTSSIADPGTWLSTLDAFGLLTDRAVLVEQFTVAQNLALPLSIAVEELSSELRDRVSMLAREVGLDDLLDRQAGVLSPAQRARIRLGRALALDPRVLVAEHPSATIPPGDTAAFAADLSRIIEDRGLTSLVLTADQGFARAASREVLLFEPATGALKPASMWRRWLG